MLKEVTDSVEGLVVLVEVPLGDVRKTADKIAVTATRLQNRAREPTVLFKSFMDEVHRLRWREICIRNRLRKSAQGYPLVSVRRSSL